MAKQDDEIDEPRLRGVVLDNRVDYIMAEVQDALDHAMVKVNADVMAEAAKGPLSASFAVAKWYEVLAIRGLRHNLARSLKGRVSNPQGRRQ